MLDKICAIITGAVIMLAIVFACLFALFSMGNSVYKTYQSYDCSESGGIPVEVANYIHCHE